MKNNEYDDDQMWLGMDGVYYHDCCYVSTRLRKMEDGSEMM